MRTDDQPEELYLDFTAQDIRRYSAQMLQILRRLSSTSWESISQIRHPRTQILGMNHYVEQLRMRDNFDMGFFYNIYRDHEPRHLTPLSLAFNTSDRSAAIFARATSILPGYRATTFSLRGGDILQVKRLNCTRLRYVLEELGNLSTAI